jgi:hypothetical protein
VASTTPSVDNKKANANSSNFINNGFKVLKWFQSSKMVSNKKTKKMNFMIGVISIDDQVFN